MSKLKTKWWGVNVSVVEYDDLGFTDLGYVKAGSYRKGWVYPFAILFGGGTIRVLKKRAASTLPHELQHANDMISPMRIIRRFTMSRAELVYWRELRAEVQGVYQDRPPNFAITRLNQLLPGKTREDVANDMNRVAKKLAPLKLVWKK